MAGLSIWHVILFLAVVVLLFGTSKLKNLGKDLGGAVKDFKDSVKKDELPALEHEQKSVIHVQSNHADLQDKKTS